MFSRRFLIKSMPSYLHITQRCKIIWYTTLGHRSSLKALLRPHTNLPMYAHQKEALMAGKLDNSKCKDEKLDGFDYSRQWTARELVAEVTGRLKGHPPLLKRSFKSVAGTAAGDKPVVRVLQWNILAQALSSGADNFVKCPTEALAWDTRRLRVLEEILTTEADILCLQEVDHYGFLSPILRAAGYEGVFLAKPDSPALYAADSNGADGCAMFYAPAKLDLVSREGVVLKANGVITNQVAVLFTLRTKGEIPKEFCVATTHLKAKSSWSTLRRDQGSFLLEYLKYNCGERPIIVCGDFNAECTEPVYEAFDTSVLSLTSAYKQLQSNNVEPPYTTWKIRGLGEDMKEYMRTIDYIWYSKEKFAVHNLLTFPTGEEVGPDRLPGWNYPSDHFSLVADFSII